MSWRDRAACRGLTDLMTISFDLRGRYPSRHARQHIDRARQICAGCPVRTECLEWAIGEHQRMPWRDMIIAGHTPTELAELTPPRRTPVRHGTPYGYQQHHQRGETACPACKHAHTAARQEHRALHGRSDRPRTEGAA